MTDTPLESTPSERFSPDQKGGQPPTGTPASSDRLAHDETAAGQRSPREDLRRTPGDGTLQDATPAGLSADELRQRAEQADGSAQPGTG